MKACANDSLSIVKALMKTSVPTYDSKFLKVVVPLE